MVRSIHRIESQSTKWMFDVLFYRGDNNFFNLDKETDRNECEKLARKDGCGDYLSKWRDGSSATHHYDRKERKEVCLYMRRKNKKNKAMYRT